MSALNRALRRALRGVFGNRFVGPHVSIAGSYSGATRTPDRSWLPGYVQGARQDINPGDRVEMVRKARYFERNSALVQKILDLIETNVVGTGIAITADSSSPEWNAAAQRWWLEWCKSPDLCSHQGLGTLQALLARAQAVDGEAFVYLTNGDTGRPRLQLLETQRVLSAGVKQKGLTEFDGILFDQLGRPAFYEVTNDDDAFSTRSASSVTLLPASSVVHVFEPARCGQPRGLTLFHSILHTLHDLDDLQRYEMLAAKDAASRANIVKTSSGEVDAEALLRGHVPAAASGDSAPYYEKAFGGKTVVLRPGDEWTQATSLRPSAAMREFWEYLTENCCKGVGLSFAAVQDYRGGWGGAPLRAAIASDNRFYQVRTDSLIPALSRIYRHAVGWAWMVGELPPPPLDWDRIQCHPPRRSTVDIGRESKAIMDELRVGLRTFRDVLGETGSDWREIIRQRIMEQKFIADTAKEMDVPAGLVLGMLGAASNTTTFGEKAAEAVDGEDTPPASPDSGVAAVHAHAAGEAAVVAFAAPTTIELPEGVDFTAPASFVWMPVGAHVISAGSLSGDTFNGKVICDEAGARAVAKAYERHVAEGQLPWIDFNHGDAEAAAWVRGFSWDPQRGIMCRVEWTELGQQALRQKAYRSFSPAFLVSRESCQVVGLIYGHAAGGLVNAPAFGAAMPALVAARLGDGVSNKPAPGGNPEQTTSTMTKEQLLKLLAALKITAPADATVDDLVALVAKHTPNQAELEAAAVKAKAEAEAANKELAATKAREAAVLEQLASLKSAAPAVATPPAVAPAVVQAAAVTAPRSDSATVRAGAVDTLRAMAKETDHQKRGAIYRDVRAFIREHQAEVLPVLAANTLGSLAGDLIVLRSLDLLKLSFPVLGAITTDFSSEQARQGQAIKTRIVTVPSVVTLNDSTGWASSNAVTTDVSVTIGQPKGVQIEYTSTELGSTGRDLFGEQVEACHYALAKDLVDALYAVITAGNFTNATTRATASVSRVDVVAMAKALTGRGVAQTGRTLLLNQDTYEKVYSDTSVVSLATSQKAAIIEEGRLPRISGFDVFEAVNLPSTGNLTGFAFTKDALVVATRLPEDYTRNVPAGVAHGGISVVTNPDVGISVQKVDFVDHLLAKAYSRIAWAYGVGKGNGSSGQRLISA